MINRSCGDLGSRRELSHVLVATFRGDNSAALLIYVSLSLSFGGGCHSMGSSMFPDHVSEVRCAFHVGLGVL